MSAFGTKKPLSDVELQLSFPTVFEQAYAVNGQPLAFEGGEVRHGRGLPFDKNLQGAYHEEKRREAHATVLSAVKDTRAATNRALVSHAGYWAMPPAVLAQRVYANPSMGSGQADIYPARRTASGSTAPFTCTTGGALSGGVLRSKQGQEFGKRILMNRIAQLNAIDAAKAASDAGAPVQSIGRDPDFAVSQGLPEQPGLGGQARLNVLISALNNSLSGGVDDISALSLSDLSELMKLLFRYAPISNREELEEMVQSFDEAEILSRTLEQQLDEKARLLDDDNVPDRKDAALLVRIVPRLRNYTREMLKVVDRLPKERLAASKTAFKSLGLNKAISGEYRRAVAVGAHAPQGGAPNAGGRDDDMGDDFGDGAPPREEEEAVARGFTPVTDLTQSSSDSKSSDEVIRQYPPGSRAERLAARNARAYLSDPRRMLDEPGPQRFARQGSLGYFGEAGAASRQPALINPMRDATPLAEAEQATTAAYRQAPIPFATATARQTALDRAKLPTGLELPEATEAVLRPAPTPRGLGKVKTKIVSDAVNLVKGMVSTKGTKKSAAVAPMPAPAPKPKPAPKGKGHPASDKWIKDVLGKIKTEVKKGRPAMGPKLLNGSGNRHKGPHHKHTDGKYYTGKTHTAKSKALTVA